MTDEARDGIDWGELARRAVEIAQNAYAPYSDFPVGAAGLVDDGRIVTGCNVENASLGLSLCAECGMVSALQATGGGRLVAVSTRKGDGDPVVPCGRCRQLLFEFGGADLLVDGDGEPRRLGELIVDAFGPGDLNH